MRKRVSPAWWAVGASMAFGWVTRAQAQSSPVIMAPPVHQPATAERSAPPNGTILGAGIATFVFSYGASVGAAISSDHKGDNDLYIPVAGPWLDLGSRGCKGETIQTPDGPFELSSRSHCGTSGIESAALITSGILQGVGALSIMGAFFIPQKRSITGFQPPPMPKFAIVPTFGLHGMGAMARGRF